MRLWRYCLAGLVYDLLYFMAWQALPVLAVRHGATSFQLALLQTASSVAYVAVCFASGRLADRFPKPVLMGFGTGGILLWCVGLALSGSLTAFFCLVAAGGVAGAVFWPAIQGAIGSETPPERMDHALGLFNVTWCIGKALGFLTAGLMEPTTALWVAAALAVPTWALLPSGERPVRRELHDARDGERAVFRTLGYVANFAAFGVGASFQNQYIKFLEGGGLKSGLAPGTFFGIFLSTVFFAQTAMFWVLQRGSRWTYRRGLLYVSQLLLAGSAAAVPWAPSESAALGIAVLVGAGLGFSYSSSIYYSLHGPAQHGKYAGLHEAVLGAGTFLVPLAGGHFADRLGDLRVPYWLGAAAVLSAIVLEEAVYRRSSRS